VTAPTPTVRRLRERCDARTKGITPNNVYDLDLFHAERPTTESNFRSDTSLTFVDCGYVVPKRPR
jgi:fibro-slime domain-containing protein